MLSRLLCRFEWYRHLRGGQWVLMGGQWLQVRVIQVEARRRVSVEVVEPLVFFTDDTSLRHDVQEHLGQDGTDRR